MNIEIIAGQMQNVISRLEAADYELALTNLAIAVASLAEMVRDMDRELALHRRMN